MKILGIDTATTYCGIALVEDDKFIGEYSINIGNLHDRKLVTMISNLLDSCNDSLDNIDVISASIGPGSFTGLRIGLSVAKGLAISKDKKLIGVSTLDALAYRYYLTHPMNTSNTICSVMDAKRSEVYFSIYTFNLKDKVLERVSEYEYSSIINLCRFLKPETIILGDSAKNIKQCFNDKDYLFDDSEMSMADAKSVALLGFINAKLNKFDDIDKLSPIYVKDFIPIIKSEGV
jgi:tRNA threonylcarbamoyladenosine biosynthesis protein TsaB